MSENINVCEYIESKCVHVEADCFDLEQIMESGQCFRIYKLSLQEQEKLCKSKGLENCESMAWYRVMAADKKVFVCQCPSDILLQQRGIQAVLVSLL